jgi:hypothetical protein
LAANTAGRVHQQSGGALPAPLVAGTTYYVKNPTTDTFQLLRGRRRRVGQPHDHRHGHAHVRPGRQLQQAAGDQHADYATRRVGRRGPDQPLGALRRVAHDRAQANGDAHVRAAARALQLARLQGRQRGELYVDFQISRATVTISVATPGVVTYNAHGFVRRHAGHLVDGRPGAADGLRCADDLLRAQPGDQHVRAGAHRRRRVDRDHRRGQRHAHTCGKQIYQNSVNLNSGVKVGSWYAYFNTKRVQQEAVAEVDVLDAALFDLPAYGAACSRSRCAHAAAR